MDSGTWIQVAPKGLTLWLVVTKMGHHGATMRLRTKVILLAVLPLVTALALIAVVITVEESDLARREHELVERAYMDARRAELQHYVELALSNVGPLYDDAQSGPHKREEALRLLRSLDYGADGYFFVYDLSGTVLMHSREPELVGRNLWNLRDGANQPTVQQLIERARAGGGFVNYQWRKPSNGQMAGKLGYVVALERWNWMVGTGLYLDDIRDTLARVDAGARRNIGTTIAWVAGIALLGIVLISAGGLTLNVSEYRVADAKLRLLARQIVQSQEDERAHLARDLHDGTSQKLVATKLLIESAVEHARAGGSPQDLLKNALARLNDTLNEVRGISHRLRPALLDTRGLASALQHLGGEVAQASGIDITTPTQGQSRQLPDVVNTAFFRIAQEALTNIVKHARARRIEVALEFESNGDVALLVTDDGTGFDVVSVQQDPRRGLGLRSMRERIDGIGGTLQIESRPAHGTQVQARLKSATLMRLLSLETVSAGIALSSPSAAPAGEVST